MSKFTKGKWEYAEYVPEGVTINGKEYIITAEDNDVALARREADARLIAAAPEMYKAITQCTDILEVIKNSDDCEYTADLYEIEELIYSLWELLARIDGDSQEVNS